MKTWTEGELNKLDRAALLGIIAELAAERNVDQFHIGPRRSSLSLLVSSILEAQEQVVGSAT